MKNILIDRELSDADITQLKKIPNLKLSISESGKITQAQLNILSSNITNLNIAFYTKNSINISKCTKLQYLECQGTKSTVSWDISNIKNLHSIVSTNNTKITGDISSMKQLQYIDVNNSWLFGTITPSTHSSLLNKDWSFIHTRNTYYNTKIVRKDSWENIIGTFAN